MAFLPLKHCLLVVAYPVDLSDFLIEIFTEELFSYISFSLGPVGIWNSFYQLFRKNFKRTQQNPKFIPIEDVVGFRNKRTSYGSTKWYFSTVFWWDCKWYDDTSMPIHSMLVTKTPHDTASLMFYPKGTPYFRAPIALQQDINNVLSELEAAPKASNSVQLKYHLLLTP